MDGFPRELFIEPVDPDFVCYICHAVFNQPVSCQDGHSFCKECISQWLVNKNFCPVDRSPWRGSLVPNRAVEGAINKYILRCPSIAAHPGGCSWTGPTSELKAHLPLCDMKVVECAFKDRGCIVRGYQREVTQHLLSCPNRTVKCHSCDLEIPHSDLSAHDEVCEAKMLPCPNRCGTDIERFKMLSHLAFVCIKEGRPCPLYSIGCTKIHSFDEGDALSHMKLLLDARVSGASNNLPVSGLDGISLAGSWKMGGDVTLPICSPLFEGHAAVVRLELGIGNANDISVKLHLESKLKLPCFGVELRCSLHSGSDKVKFSTQEKLISQAPVACVNIMNACPESFFDQMIRGSDPVVFDFLLTLSA